MDGKDEPLPTWLIVVHPHKKHLLTITDPLADNDDRVYIGARSIEEAIGYVLMQNPELTYNDVLDHMEV